MLEIKDEQILELLLDKSTEEKGFRLLMSVHQERLYWQIIGILNDQQDTKDVLQNVFVKVFRGISKFKGDSKLSSWMYRIASNESIDFLKKRSRHRVEDIEETKFTKNLLADDDMDGAKILKVLEKAITTLPEKQKQVFKMRYYEERPYAEISELLGTSIGGLKASYHHAVKKIEKYLSNEG